MKKKPTAPIKSTTQEFIEIRKIEDDVVLLKDGSCCMVIETSAINFSLLSEEEQNSLVYAFGSLLNSLSFAIQIAIFSSKMNISDYLDYLNKNLQKQSQPEIKDWLIKYIEFIKSIVTQNSVLKKRFFIIVPFSTLEMGAKGATSSNYSSDYILQRAKTAIYPKKDHVLRLLARVGLRSQVLTKTELVNFYYNLYNPSATGVDMIDGDMFESYLVHGQ
jgi:type IV secretory pathway VirB4 component